MSVTHGERRFLETERRETLNKVITLSFALLLLIIGSGWSADVRVYYETFQWIGQADAQAQGDKLVSLIDGKRGIDTVEVIPKKDVAAWMEANTDDGDVDIFVMYGDIPETVYTNADPDDSIAEVFLEGGNMFINSADYMFWGVGGRNEAVGLQNMMDIPGITMWDDDTPMKLTAEGKKYTPTLQNYNTDRPFHLDQLVPPWELEVAFATNSGDAAGTRADPVIVLDTETGGRIAIAYQTASQVDPKGEVVSEMILNYLVGEEKIGSLAIKPEGKLSTLWAEIKKTR